VAVVYQQQHLSYSALNYHSDLLSLRLLEAGVSLESVVGVCLQRSLRLPIALMGVLKAGASYVPLDGDYPPQRLAYMLEDAQPEALVTERRMLEKLPPYEGKVIEIQEQSQQQEQGSWQSQQERVSGQNLAYVIYTSGSTGRPKGAMNTHEAIVNRLRWMQEEMRLRGEDRVLQKTSFSFDVSVWEIFWPLMTGAVVVLAEAGGQADAGYLREVIGQEQITMMHFVPSMLESFLMEGGWRGCESVRRVISSGEALTERVVKRYEEEGGKGLYNLYGPTEAAVDVTYWECERGEERKRIVIGRPISNTRMYVEDGRGEMVGVGVEGELVIGGKGVGRGYWKQGGQTAERYVPEGKSGKEGERVYRTGDVVKWREEGELEYVGRRDEQVKVRGYRIELAEIEATLTQLSEIEQVVVILREDRPAENRLVAYFIARHKLDASNLRQYLKTRLPDYMIPSAFVQIEQMPLTANGKLDRRALPKPDIRKHEMYAGPSNAVEQILCGIWSKLLGIDQVGISDNFFELGGDSILCIQIIAKAREAGLHLTPKQFFQHQTIAELAPLALSYTSLQPEQDLLTGPVPLSPIQRMFFQWQLSNPHHYNQAVLLQLQPQAVTAVIEKSIHALLLHHDALRLRFHQTDGQWRQSFGDPDVGSIFSRTDLSMLEPQQVGEALQAETARVQASLNISEGPLLRAVEYELGAGGRRLLLVIHHLAVDGVSWRILLEDFQRAYEQIERGERADLGPKTTSVRRWVERLEGYRQTEEFRRESQYWLRRERRQEAGRLPVEGDVRDNHVRSARRVVEWLSEEETEGLLREVPGAYQTQIDAALITGIVAGVRGWIEGREVVIDVEGHGREDIFEGEDVSRTVGWFTTIYPVRVEMRREKTEETLKRVKKELGEIPQKGIGYGVLRYMGGEGEKGEWGSREAEAEMSYNYLGQVDGVLRETRIVKGAEESAGPVEGGEEKRRYQLEVNAMVVGGRMGMEWRYSEKVNRREKIEEIAGRCKEAVKELIRGSRREEEGKYRAEEFPEAKLTQEKLDKIISLFAEDS
jgi:amino acid adenylation domain-containing protein/non-ribosomal peptide synthase protein (TIGR01720 family)